MFAYVNKFYLHGEMPGFRPYDPRAPMERTRRNLPHWQQPDATYFVTFRLADALPAAVRARFSEMRALENDAALAWVDHYLDAGSGCCVLEDIAASRVVETALRHFDGERYALGAFAVMPNHVHVLVQPAAGRALTAITHTWKSYTACALRRSSLMLGRVWQEESFDRIVRNEAELRHYDSYIMQNPVKAHLAAGRYIIGRGSAPWFDLA